MYPLNFIMIDGAIDRIRPPERRRSSPRICRPSMGLRIPSSSPLIEQGKPTGLPGHGTRRPVVDRGWHIRPPEARQFGKYTVMIMQPDRVTPEIFADMLAQLRKKKGDQPAFARPRLQRFHEGLCVRPCTSAPTPPNPKPSRRCSINGSDGCKDLVGLGGKHHEIYLGDPRRADPSKLKTVLRHPVIHV